MEWLLLLLLYLSQVSVIFIFILSFWTSLFSFRSISVLLAFVSVPHALAW